MLAWHLGLRYLRTRRAAWLALAAMALTVAVPVVVLGVMDGWVEITHRQVRANESDLTCTARASLPGVQDSSKRRADLAAIPGVRAVAPYITTWAVLTPRWLGGAADARMSIPCQIDGIDWAADTALGRLTPQMLHPTPVLDLHHAPLPSDERGSAMLTPAWRDLLVLAGMGVVGGSGALPTPPEEPPMPGVVVGRELAYVNGLYPGSLVHLLVPNGSGGATGSLTAEISDTLVTGIYEIDRYEIEAPLPVAALLGDLGARAGRSALVSGYRIALKNGTHLNAMSDLVGKRSGLVTTTWRQRRGNLVKSLQQQANVLTLVMICIQVIAVFIVYAVFSTLVAEKRHDLGVLLGIGARPGAIAGAFLIASLVACTIGDLVGWGLGWGALALLNPISDYFHIALFPQDVFYAPDAPVSYDIRTPLFFMTIMGAVALAASLLPAWKASRIDPVEIIRESGG